MELRGNLSLERVDLRPGGELLSASGPWRFLRLTVGEAYWLGPVGNRTLVHAELVLLGPAVEGVVRASILGPAVIHFFTFSSRVLLGLFSLSQSQYLADKSVDQGSVMRALPSTHPAAQRLEAVIQGRMEDAHGLLERAELLSIALCALEEVRQPYFPPPPLGGLALDRFRRLVSDLPDLELANHTPAELATLCGCSRGHFHRMFRNQFGLSYRDRQAQLKAAAREQAQRNGALGPELATRPSSPKVHNCDAGMTHTANTLACSSGEDSHVN